MVCFLAIACGCDGYWVSNLAHRVSSTSVYTNPTLNNYFLKNFDFSFVVLRKATNVGGFVG
jgi:hypothetical protein